VTFVTAVSSASPEKPVSFWILLDLSLTETVWKSGNVIKYSQATFVVVYDIVVIISKSTRKAQTSARRPQCHGIVDHPRT